MPKIDIRMGDIRWPPKCCRCGSPEFAYHSRTENVVTRTVISATESVAITLNNVPICDRCENARRYWFGGAIAFAAIGSLFLYLAGSGGFLQTVVLALYVIAVLLAIVGTNKSPVRIIKFDERTNLLRIEIYNRDVASEMLKLESGRTDLQGHAEYLAIQEEKQKKKDREVRLTIRTICVLGFALGLYLVYLAEAATGYSVMIMSLLFCLPFEIKHLRKK
jgi:hypothetical protein